MRTPQLPALRPGRPSHRTKLGTITGLAVAAAAVIGASASPAAAGTATAAARGTITPYVSSWASGYAAVPLPGGPPAFTHIQDIYTLPALNCGVTPNAVAQFRTGLDGISDNTIERVGVSAVCSGGVFKGYIAWHQMLGSYPGAEPHPILTFSPMPGDVLRASITVGPPGAYTLSLQDLSRPLGFTVPALCAPATCLDSSAQVTAGPPGPGSAGGPPGGAGTPVADFGTVHYHGILVTNGAGATGGLVSLNWNTDMLIQPSSPPPYTVAGPLAPPYTAFTDKWK